VRSMARFEFTTSIAASPEQCFALWIDLDRAHEWLRGMGKVTDVTGPLDQPGTSYVMWFSGRPTRNEVLEVQRPRLFRSHIGGSLFRGTNEARFDPEDGGTRLTQRFETEGLPSSIVVRIFATGSWPGSFRAELETFKRIAERDAREEPPPPAISG
jgi:uncharacterized protein YndB with AHSA1/START domain